MTGIAFTADSIEIDADPAEFYALSRVERWGDGAPLLPPTDAAICALLEATPYPPDHVLGVLPPRHGVATVELVATITGTAPTSFTCSGIVGQ